MEQIKFPPVLTKVDFVRRFQLGEFGNRGPVWNSFEEFEKEVPNVPSNRLYHVRNRIAGGVTYYNIEREDVYGLWSDAVRMSGKDTFYFAEMAPTDKTVVQGEVMVRENGVLYAYLTHVKKPMRDALKEKSFEMIGISAITILKHCMDVNSWEWLNVLLERYEDHVIEFSTYSVNWGCIPNRNSVIWEVRKGY